MLREYSYYLYEIHTGKESENNKYFSATIGISFLLGMNLMSLWGIINYLFNLIIPKDSVVFLSILISIFISTINYFYIYKKRKSIIKKVEEFSSRRERIGKISFVLYILATLFLIFYVVENLSPIR